MIDIIERLTEDRTMSQFGTAAALYDAVNAERAAAAAEILALRADIDAAVAAEREACAKLCESRTSSAVIAAGPRDRFGLAPVDQVVDRKHEGMTYAAAIRARGEQAKDGK